MSWNYEQLKQLIRGERLPVMVVDLDILDAISEDGERIEAKGIEV